MFIKSSYLNDSKYSNSIAHFIRIFFEREVKTRPIPTTLGTLFKGSKWSDYKTRDVSTSLIKSYLYTIITLFILFCILLTYLGRSKSEQYFGFIPFFHYINFFVGWAYLFIYDILSQIYIYIYIIFLFFSKLTSYLLKYLSSNFVYSFMFSRPTNNRFYRGTLNYNNLNTSKYVKPAYFYITTNKYTLPKLSFSTKLTNTGLNMLPVTTVFPYTGHRSITNFYQKLTYHTIPQNNPYNNHTTIHGEVFYTNIAYNTFGSRGHLNTSIYTIANFVNRTTSTPVYYDFNFLTNLLNSKEQRWLVKNSLLTEFLINNSFQFTQSKQLFGLGAANRDLSAQNLWLPSKVSNLSLLETKIYLSNMSSTNYIDMVRYYTKFITKPMVNYPNITNINFFENSRFWLFKKYFFNNSLPNNLLTKGGCIHNVNPVRIKNNFIYQGYLNLNSLLKTHHTVYNKYILPKQNPKFIYGPGLCQKDATKYQINIILNLNNLDLIEGANTPIIYLLTSNISSSQHLTTVPYYNNLNPNRHLNNTYVTYKH